MNDFMTIRDFAEMYRVSDKTIRRWIASGELPAERLPGGRLIRIDVANLQKLTRPVGYVRSPRQQRHNTYFTISASARIDYGSKVVTIEWEAADAK